MSCRWEQKFTPFVSEFGGFQMESDQSAKASLAYLVHDLNDAAVHRRVNLFAREGFAVGLAGFRRHTHAPPTASTSSILDLGRTMDARLVQRAGTVARYLVLPGAIRDLCSDVPVIVARNLEMLVLAWRVRSPRQRLVYECLDIHRMMLGAGIKSRLMRWIERRLMDRADLVIVSSPAFARDYFAVHQGRHDGILLVENKLPAERQLAAGARSSGDGAAWKIGWFGMLRCRKTLDQLAALASTSAGKIEVVIAGIPSPAEFTDFSALVADCPGLRFLGAFAQDDLPRLYEDVDFVWAIDYFEEGLNSSWLLPNRLYEGLAHGVVPIALRSVETGRWLAGHGVGLLVDDPSADVPERLAALTAGEHRRMQEVITSLPQHLLYQTPAERQEIAAAVAGGSCV
jgi:succinoglycan biosynthesis protein ExoL